MGISLMKVNDNVNENYYYDRCIIGETQNTRQVVCPALETEGRNNNLAVTVGLSDC